MKANMYFYFTLRNINMNDFIYYVLPFVVAKEK